MTVCCIGINNGSDVPLFGWMHPLERENWIVDFRLHPIVCPNGKDDLELTVEGYEPPPAQKAVRIILRRCGSSMPIWDSLVNSLHLSGVPQLKWADWDVR